MRTLASASKALRLYPAASPIPRQSVEAAQDSLAQYFAESGDPILSLHITREGFMYRGEALPSSVSGGADLLTELRDHAVAELAITPGPSIDEMLSFLVALGTAPDAVRAQGGLGAALAAAGVDSIRVSDVQLTVVEQIGPAADEDVEEFLRELIKDPERLSAWFAAASAGDPHAFEEGLMELVRVSGVSGYPGLLDSLSKAFLGQSPEGKDALLGLAMDRGAARDLTGGMFSLLGSTDIAGAVLGGSFGKNMLSLSSALTNLPLEQVTAQVRAEVQAMLPGAGKTTKEAEFLDHMLEVRGRTTPEPSLVDADTTYRAVLDASALSEETIAKARGAVAGSAGVLSAVGVRTMLTLLDQQRDLELYCDTATNLANMVPRLIEQGDVALAARVVSEIARREQAGSAQWPELAPRMREALETAVGPRAMSALVKAVIANPASLDNAKLIAREAGQAGGPALMTEAIALKAEGLAAAEQLLGRRSIDLLNQVAPQAQWFQLGPVAARLAAEGDTRSAATLDTLMRRPDEQSRREVVSGVASAGGPLAPRILAAALRDPSAEVAIVSVRAISRSGISGSAALIAARLSELDVDNADFPLAREMIGALARIPEPAADEALAKLAGRRALMKRGHFGEVQDLVRQAQQIRAQGGGTR